MQFRYLGKKTLLKILQDKSFNPFTTFESVIYTREEHFNVRKTETIVYIDGDTHYRVRYEYSKDTQKSTLYYEEIKQLTPNNFNIQQKIIIYESEKN